MRRNVLLVSSALLAATIMAARTPGADAAVNSCRARDVTQGTPWGSNLQTVIRAASTGDVIAVKFECVGNFTIAKALTLVGKPTAGFPRAVLNANGDGQVLVIGRAHVTLNNVKITGGSATSWHVGAGITTDATLELKNTVVKRNAGTGIYNTGRLTLSGSSVVSQNSQAGIHQDGFTTGASLTMNGTSSVARNDQDGIYSYYATTTLNDASSVTRNITYGGASIWNWDGVLTLNGSASVSDNAGPGSAVDNFGTLVMNGSSTVRGNTAHDSWGGGIFNASTGSVTMNDSSSVVGNVAARSGGGIRTDGAVTMNGSSFVTGNTADFDDDGVGAGGGIKVTCGGTLVGAVDGGNVNDNLRGTASPVEDNIAIPPCT